ncbi:MAG TPA: CheR family methyltransferase, partial [Polyangiaceae bacterium]|nr:CheR family methyltransferase [Polyangiaceae bacterium]
RTLEAPPALQIFATDLNEDVILTARNGVYSDSVVADLSLERLRRFFIKEHQGYRVRRELREMLLFAVHDLLKDSPFSRLDMVSCRNLLIYLNRDAQQRAFDIFHFSLRPEGRLFLGASEAIDDNSQAFVPTDKKFRIYMPRSAVRMNLPIPPSAPFSLRAPGGVHEKLEVSLPPSTPDESAGVGIALLRRTRQEHGSWSELHFKLIERFGPPSLLVNNQHEIVHLSENVGRFLQFTGGEPSMSLLRAVHPALRVDLRAALYRANQSGEPTSALRVPMDLGGARLSVDIHVSPAGESATDFLLVVFDAHENTDKDTARTGPQEDEPVVWHIERELEQTKRHLRDLVEQHEASTEELKASNEELQAMNEELRSATEELETSREELQSINEELTTVNQELKAKVDELGHTNSDLHNLMGATAIATVFLDRELRIMRFTPPAVALFSLIPTDVGRPLADLKHRLDYADLLPDAARVLQQLVPIEREVSEYGGRVFLARLLPYRTTEDRIAGVVLTFVDVTERHLAQEAVRRAHEELERRVQERTAQLDEANAALRREILEHQRAERARQELQARLIGAQEEERAHFSRELHDEVGQQLTALMLSLKAIESAVQGEAAAQELRSLRSTAELVAREIHQLATELRPIVLDDLGLARALTSYIEAWATRTGISVDFVFSGFEENRLPSGIETTLYRIVQEAMNNVVKHAHAKNVSVCIERYEDRVVGSVEDDGEGFDVDSLSESVTESHRIGIAGMRERAAIVAGTLSLESAVGRGTVVRVNIPLPQSSKMP